MCGGRLWLVCPGIGKPGRCHPGSDAAGFINVADAAGCSGLCHRLLRGFCASTLAEASMAACRITQIFTAKQAEVDKSDAESRTKSGGFVFRLQARRGWDADNRPTTEHGRPTTGAALYDRYKAG